MVAKVVKARRPPTHQSGDQENEYELIPAMIETTAAVHPGGSGGAVVNSDGHMIGLVTRYNILVLHSSDVPLVTFWLIIFIELLGFVFL